MSSSPSSRRRLRCPPRVFRTGAMPGSSTARRRRAGGGARSAGGLDWARRIELVSVVIASLVAVGGLWYSNAQTKEARDEASQVNSQARQDRALSKEGQITDRYTAAVTNLGDDKMEVRLGGIYALQRIMQDSHRDQPTIANVLAAYLRSHASEPPRKGMSSPADVLAAFSVLAVRDPRYDDSLTLNLAAIWVTNSKRVPVSMSRDEDLEPCRLTPKPAKLANTDLSGAHLSNVLLNHADMKHAILIGADLSNSNLSGADLTQAELPFVDLRHASLNGAQLGESSLVAADMSDAVLFRVNLRGSSMSDAILRNAQMGGADLRNADLRRVDLRGANLMGADLRGAKLHGAKLKGARISADQLRSVNL